MGLMDMGTQAPQPGAAPAPGAAESDRLAPYDGETPNVSPEEQADYDMLVNNAIEFLHPDGKVNPQVVEWLEQYAGESGGESEADGPVAALAWATLNTVILLEQSAEQGGKELNPEVVFGASQEQIMPMIAEIAQAGNIYDYSEAEMGDAFTLASLLYQQEAVSSGRLDPAALQAEFEEFRAADQQGQAAAMAPQLASAQPAEPPQGV